jgi:hypothetical protein
MGGDFGGFDDFERRPSHTGSVKGGGLPVHREYVVELPATITFVPPPPSPVRDTGKRSNRNRSNRLFDRLRRKKKD